MGLGCGVSSVRRATSPVYVAAAWRRHYPALAASSAPLLVMTNEKEPRYAKRLQSLVSSARFAHDLGEVRSMHAEMHDNYLVFQTLRFAAAHADARIATTGCYLASGCHHYLVEACPGSHR